MSIDFFVLLDASELLITDNVNLSENEKGAKILEIVNNIDLKQYKIEAIQGDNTTIIIDKSKIKDALIIALEVQGE
jgi:hypothetical protein